MSEFTTDSYFFLYLVNKFKILIKVSFISRIILSKIDIISSISSGGGLKWCSRGHITPHTEFSTNWFSDSMQIINEAESFP